MWRSLCWLVLGALVSGGVADAAQETPGSIRGVVHDRDFDVPLAGALVLIAETGQRTLTTDQGHFVFGQVPAGRYTLVFSKEGYVRQVRPDVVVARGELRDVDAALAGEVTEMEELLVQDVGQIGGASELGLLNLRLQAPSFLDSIGADLMSRAGASDAASALRLVAGASVQDGKYAVIRGLPDRYVSSQMNGVRLPTADEDKRAVELDQFPAAVIESIQVSKTFTPDQQGDASGGAVNVRLRGMPETSFFRFKGEASWNSQAGGRDDFLTYDGGGVSFWSREDRDIPEGTFWPGAVGTTRDDAPIDHKWSLAAGGNHEVDDGIRIGGLLSFFYERDSSFDDDGRNDAWWITQPGGPLTPQYSQGAPSQDNFKTSLFDVTQGSESVQWGGLATLGLETDNHSIGLTYLYTHTAEDKATLAEDTRGKSFFFPGYVATRPSSPGNMPPNDQAAPWLRTETLEYTERTADTLQLHGRHRLPFEGFGPGDSFGQPEIDWVVSKSSASLDQPDKRQFGAFWLPPHHSPGFPPNTPPSMTPPMWFPLTPSENINLGNSQRIWKTIDEESTQYALDVKLPFEQWDDEPGYLKLGLFDDRVERHFDQDTFSNFGDSGASFQGDWSEPWSEIFPTQTPGHPMTASEYDVDYDGEQKISALYAMADVPMGSSVNVIGGARFESTEIGIQNKPESLATWFPPGDLAPVMLNPGDADVEFSQDDVLPSIGAAWKPADQVTLRAAYSRTVARQTFKELTPILQQEFAGGPVFIGNPSLGMSALENYDLRADWVPHEGGLVSLSWFDKRIEDPIEYVQSLTTLVTYTTAVNYPKGKLSGFELELRQRLESLWEPLQGFTLGANATLIDSQVTLPDDEADSFAAAGTEVDLRSRDMTNAPEHLYNLFLTWESEETGTQIGLFYTIQGDTLVAGAGESNGNFVPNVYQREYDTLNLSLSQKLGEHFSLQFAVKNLTNPDIETVYRPPSGDEVIGTSFSRGIEFSLGLGAQFSF